VRRHLTKASPHFYVPITDRLREQFRLPRMELHFIADDLEDHNWYVDLVADLVENVERFAAAFAEVDGFGERD
jgi:hypothetical protein